MKTTRSLLSLLLLTLLVCFCACDGGNGNPEDTTPKEPWDDATYVTDTTLGTGATTIYVEVAVDEHLVTFTIHTDATMLDDALTSISLISGDEEQYGLYVKVVNGITADYNIDQTYWALYIDGDYALTGISGTEVVAGTTYRLSREK